MGGKWGGLSGSGSRVGGGKGEGQTPAVQGGRALPMGRCVRPPWGRCVSPISNSVTPSSPLCIVDRLRVDKGSPRLVGYSYRLLMMMMWHLFKSI